MKARHGVTNADTEQRTSIYLHAHPFKWKIWNREKCWKKNFVPERKRSNY